MPRPVVTLVFALALGLAPPSVSAASAYTYWRPVEEAVLYDGPARVVAATVAFGHLNDPRVALTVLADEAPQMRVAVRDRESGSWRVLPVPNGQLVRGWPDVSWVVPADRVLSAWTRAPLGPDGFGPPERIGRSSARMTPVLPGGRRAMGVLRDPSGKHLLYGDGHDGAVELARGPAILEAVLGDDDATWAIVRKGDVVRGKKVPGPYRFAVPDVAAFEVALGHGGEVAFAALTTYGTLQLLDPARGYERLPNVFGSYVAPPDPRCVEAPCERAQRSAELEDVMVLKKKHAALVWTLTSTRTQRRCVPSEATEGGLACTEEGLGTTRDPRIWWTADVASGRESLAPALGWELAPPVQDADGDYPQQVLAASADFNGDVHLVVREKVGGGSRVRWLRLGFESFVRERAIGEVVP
ncbi:MAG: hypothetical protein EP329_08565 [Deltaproteobacteria bacterium]|nr:MAG: hypothetical protein EP329_08565 [Deltaproteobacteria bacterium]